MISSPLLCAFSLPQHFSLVESFYSPEDITLASHAPSEDIKKPFKKKSGLIFL